MIDKTKVLEIVKEKGPVLPRDVVKSVGGDTFFVGAVLSQLADNGLVKISHAKVGGSPVYYVSGQEEKLSMLHKFLHEREKQAYEKLKEEKVIRDSSAAPALRVALRNIRDFAKALEVNIGDQRAIFWKWYLLPNSGAEPIIRDLLGQARQEEPKDEKTPEPSQEKSKEPQEEPIEKPKEEPKEPEKPKPVEKDKDDELLSMIEKEFSDREIEILETEVLRKNSDVEMVVNLPSAVGKLKYFCKIRDKKRCNDKDLSAAYVQSQMRKLPVLFVTTGKLTKKAEEMLDQEFKMIALLRL